MVIRTRCSHDRQACPTTARGVTRRGATTLLVILGFAMVWPGVGEAASLVDQVIQFYTSSVPNPPRVPADYQAIRGVVETGDIIIENNRAFPQWYAMIGSLIPNCRFVHAGMVIKGHLLKTLAAQISPSAAVTVHAYHRGGPPRIVDGKIQKVFDWMPYPIDPQGTYVVTPEVTINTTISRVVALNLKDYVLDPAIGYPTKHLRIIRPRIGSQQALHNLAKYLTYHVIKATTYDMGFDLSEREPAIRRERNGELWFDLSAQPVPLYCTELVWRALREVGLQVPTTQVKRGIADALGRVPRMPRSVVQKLDAAFITADGLLAGGSVIYENEPPPTVRQALGAMVDREFRSICEGLATRCRTIIGGGQ